MSVLDVLEVPDILIDAKELHGRTAKAAAHKQLVHDAAVAFLRKLAEHLGLAKGSFDIRIFPGVETESGQVTLHADDIVIQLFELSHAPGLRLVYRPCASRKDVRGGREHFEVMASLRRTACVGPLVAHIRNVLAEERELKAQGLDWSIRAMLDERARTMKNFSPDHRPMNLYAIYRADLEMPAGKLAAQCGHAFHLALEQAEEQSPGIGSSYKGSGNGTKICMYAQSLRQLLRAYHEARAAGLPCALVIDRGHVMSPHFDGQPVITAVGIGPVFRDQAEPITRRYSLAR